MLEYYAPTPAATVASTAHLQICDLHVFSTYESEHHMSNPLQPQPHSNGIQVPWSWCARCHRAYITGTYRIVHVASTSRNQNSNALKLCPYFDCSGSSTTDRWRWDTIRERHPQYPEYPQLYVLYNAVTDSSAHPDL